MPVVERSVTIAGISTRELVLKDYVTDQSEEKLRKAGQLMGQKLAGSLALVTCKEPLKSNLAGYIRTSLTDFGFAEVSPRGIHGATVVLSFPIANRHRASGRAFGPGQPRHRMPSRREGCNGQGGGRGRRKFRQCI